MGNAIYLILDPPFYGKEMGLWGHFPMKPLICGPRKTCFPYSLIPLMRIDDVLFRTLRIYLQYTMAIFVRTATSFPNEIVGGLWMSWYPWWLPPNPMVHSIFSLWAMAAPEDVPWYTSFSDTPKKWSFPSWDHFFSSAVRRSSPFCPCRQFTDITFSTLISQGDRLFPAVLMDLFCRTYLDASWASERLFTPNVENYAEFGL